MKVLLFTILISLGLAATSDAQIRLRVPQNPNIEQQPLYIINSMESDMNHIWLNADKITSVRILKDSAAALYGEKGKNGVIFIDTKPSTEFLKLSTLFDQFNISEKDRSLKICKDKMLVLNPEKILADRSDIINVEIITDHYWLTPLIVGSEERFINITTRLK